MAKVLRLYSCSFCKRHANGVGYLVAADDACICDRCVVDCMDIIDRAKAKETSEEVVQMEKPR